MPKFSLSADDSFYRITFGGNIKNIPLETYNTNKDIKALGLKLNNWIFSPTNSSFIGNESESIFSKSKNAKEIFFIRFHAKF